MSTRKASVTTKQIRYAVDALTAAGKSIALIALTPRGEALIYTKRLASPLGTDLLESELETFLSSHGKD